MEEFEPKKKIKIFTREFFMKYSYVFILALVLLIGTSYSLTFFVQNKKIVSGSLTTAPLNITASNSSINASSLSVPTTNQEGLNEFSKSLTITNDGTTDGKVKLTLTRTSGLNLTDMSYALVVNGTIQEISDVPSDGVIYETAIMGNEVINVELKLWPKTTYTGSETTFVGGIDTEIGYLGPVAASNNNLSNSYVKFNCNGNTCETWRIVKVENGRLVLTREADLEGATSRTDSGKYNPNLSCNDSSMITSVSTDNKNVYLAKTVKIIGGDGTQDNPYQLINNIESNSDKKIAATITYSDGNNTTITQNVYYNETNYISQTVDNPDFQGWSDGTNTYQLGDTITFTSDTTLSAIFTSHLTIANNNLNLAYGTNGESVYTYDGDGIVSCNSSDTQKATCTVDTTNNKIIVTPVNITTSPITITVSAAKGNNYLAPSDVTFSVNISRKAIAFPVCETFTYNGLEQTLYEAHDNEYVNSILKGTNAGNYTVNLTPGDNYEWSSGNNVTSSRTLTCTINQKNLTITAKNQTVNYGTAISTGVGQVDVDGLVNGDSLTSVTLTASTTNVPGGTITPSSGATSNGISNYSVTYNNGTLTINKVAAVISCSDKTYNGTEQTACSCSGGTIGGEYKATNYRSSAYSASCTGDANHSNPSNVTWTMNKKAVTVTAGSSSRGWNGSALTNSSCTGNSLVSGHTVTCTMTSGSTITTAGNVNNVINTVTIKSGSTDVTSNYSITNANGKLTITTVTPTVSLSAKSANWTGNRIAANTATVSPNGGGAITYTYYTNSACSSGATTTAPSAAGTYYVKASVAAVANKTNAASSSCVSHTINKVAASITCKGAQTYTGSAITSYSSSSGCASITNQSPTNAGTYTVKCNQDGNHNTSPTCSFTINKKATTMSLSATSGTIACGGKATITITTNGDGSLSCSSNATGKATCSISGKTLTINHVAEGSATITVSQAAGTNYAATSKTYTATLGTCAAWHLGGDYPDAYNCGLNCANYCNVLYKTTVWACAEYSCENWPENCTPSGKNGDICFCKY